MKLTQPWILVGSHPHLYKMDMGRDEVKGLTTVLLKSEESNMDCFGALRRSLDPQPYLNKRLRMTAAIKTEDAEEAALWFRVDGAEPERIVLDNMYDRAVIGSCDWKLCELVLDVPADAKAIYYGALLSGNGKLWMTADTQFEEVNQDVPVTGLAQ